MALRQLAQALPALPVTQDDGGPIENKCRPSDTPALEFRSAHAGVHSFDDQAALQLRLRS